MSGRAKRADAGPSARYVSRQQQQAANAVKPRGKNVGKLSFLLNAPKDVFFEVCSLGLLAYVCDQTRPQQIASHLKPLDVLYLARVSRPFRHMLLSPSSRHVWIAARKNVYPKLPDCPRDLDEPLYAHLVFERSCMACVSCPHTRTVPRSLTMHTGMWCRSRYQC